MSLVTLPDKIAVLDSHTLLVMAEGDRCQAVCILDDVLPLATSKKAHELTDCLDLFEQIADRKLAEGQVAYDGRVWITSSDVAGFLAD
ncbi:MAG: hypothetical protein KGI75_08065 [Rhizobiaceae bacterium]|nr:hypothetical protein [Rhizobiaceae bacterium]